MKILLVFVLSILTISITFAPSVYGIAFFPPPLKQIADGVSPKNVTCTEGLEIVFKLTTGLPACLKPSSVAKLIDRGWAIHVLPDVDSSQIQNSDALQNGIYDVQTSTVEFNGFNGFLAKPDSNDLFPGIIMIHEWWGLNQNIKDTAERLASNGYVVLAVDLFNGDVATDAQKAMQMVAEFDQQKAITNMNSATKYLQTTHDVQSLGSIGWCFGGAQSLTLALENTQMDVTVIYYGKLVTDTETLSAINWPVLGIFGELDQGIPVTQVNEFEASLNELEIQNEIHIYPGVDHAFANPTGSRYAPVEADDAWNKTIDFFNQNLK